MENLENLPLSKVCIIAEIGFNHGGNLALAKDMIKAAKTAGADAAKFQTYRAENLVLENTPHFNAIKAGEMSQKDHEELSYTAKKCDIAFLSTPYCQDSVDILERVGVPAYKIASMDLTNAPLIRTIATQQKPMIISTGMATIDEIGEAIEVVKAAGNSKIILLHCISKYPTLLNDIHVRAMQTLERTFHLPVGLSDHTTTNAAAFAAVSLGATVIEKHFTTDRTLPGADNKDSADPAMFADLAKGIRSIEACLGNAAALSERPDRPESKLYRRGIYASEAIKSGERLSLTMLKCVRPEAMLPPKHLDSLIGKIAKVNIATNSPLSWEMVS
jgi:sialic acid synthase SpsE